MISSTPNAPVTFDILRAAALSHRQKISHSNDETKTSQRPSIFSPRCEVLNLTALVGNLCSTLLTHAPLDPPPSSTCQNSADFWNGDSEEKRSISACMSRILLALLMTSHACSLDLRVCILKKIELNGRKYPVDLCRGKRGKYTEYSSSTGITKTSGQSTGLTLDDANLTDEKKDQQIHSSPGPDHTLAEITSIIRAFATDRKWSRYHTPRSLCLAMIGELGELSELFQWRGDDESIPFSVAFTDEEYDHVGQELADVGIYLLRLADVCQVDLGEWIIREVGEGDADIDP